MHHRNPPPDEAFVFGVIMIFFGVCMLCAVGYLWQSQDCKDKGGFLASDRYGYNMCVKEIK